MSASTSTDLLRRVRADEVIPRDEFLYWSELRAGEFFRDVIEPLCDSFDVDDARRYEGLVRQALPVDLLEMATGGNAGRTYVLSRVTLGADIKITSIILNALKDRNPILVGSRKCGELFEGVPFKEVNYPRKAPFSERIQFALQLRDELKDGMVIDPDSRITQLGLIPLGARYHHFNSRTAGGESDANLTDLTNHWLKQTFGVTGTAFLSPARVAIDTPRPCASISLGVGENESKRIPDDFESNLIRTLARDYNAIWLDRGAGGEEARRVTAAAEASGAMDRIHFWEGSFAGFASIIGQSDYYTGYDSAGQHAAAAAGIPLTTWFAGATSQRFASRWAPAGNASIEVRLHLRNQPGE